MMRRAFAAVLVAGLLGLLSFAAPPDDPFAPSNAVNAPKPAKKADVDDPFAPSNAVEEKPKTAPPKSSVKEVGKPQKTAERVDLVVSVEPQPVRRGETVRLKIVATPKPGFYTYPMTQRTPTQLESGLTEIDYLNPTWYTPLAPIQETPDGEIYDTHLEGTGIILRQTKPVTWIQDILVKPDAPTGPQTLKFDLRIQACDPKTCVIGKHTFEASIDVADAPPAPLSDTLKNRLSAKQEFKVVPVPGGSAAKDDKGSKTAKPATAALDKNVAVKPPDSEAQSSALGILLAAMGSAVLMLFTPCVFPMIPITVSFFAKQSEQEHHRPFLLAGVYSLTIIVVLSAAVLLLGTLIMELANDPWMNLGLGIVMVYFSLSLFGMYDIELPGFLARFTSSREGQGGIIGALFMALTFTITSFSCTGPFLGPLLGSVSVLKINTATLILAAVAYSATFAAPFFVLALFPSLVKKLPKSGSWLNSVKVVMGFIELALALKFLGNSDAAINPGNPWFFNYDTVLCAWIALSVGAGIYLLGFIRLPHDEPMEHVSVGRMLLATTFFGFSLYLLPALDRETPLGLVGEKLRAFLPQDSRLRKSGGSGHAELAWHADYQSGWEQAVKENKLIFFDFTGTNCPNCRDNENRVFPRPEVERELEKYVRVKLYNDVVSIPGLSAREAKRAGDRNRELQQNTFGDVATPMYIIYRPAKNRPYTDDDSKFNGEVVARPGSGTIFDNQIPAFVATLKAALNGQTTQVANAAAGK
jgi:thiol:disulfide interchange protein DsbD